MKTRPILINAVVACSFTLWLSAWADESRFDADPAAKEAPSVQGAEIWKDPAAPTPARVQDLVRRMSQYEKVSQLCCDCPAIPRLGIPAYSHRNECLHGIRSGTATVFPQAIGMAATFDMPLVHQEADAIATEARAAYNDYAAKHHGDAAHTYGLSYYTPNINIFRDPRWGRGQETYGEDPFLTARTAVAFIWGLQGDDPRYVKIMACAKHYAVHSGPESERHRMNMTPPERDLYETYLPAFEAAVREAKVGSVMGAYSSLYGKPACASPFLLKDLLRDQWGFDGFVVSDGGAIWDIWAQHNYVPDPAAAAAAAVKAGCDLSSGNPGADRPTVKRSAKWSEDTRGWLTGGTDFMYLNEAVKRGLISIKEIDEAVTHELTARFRLGLFDPPSSVPWSRIGLDQTDTPEHKALAFKVASESIVLLKNSGVLPLNRSKIKRIAVIGPNADAKTMLLGNYHGTPSQSITILDGIKAVAGPDIAVSYEKGCPIALKKDASNKPSAETTAKALAAAKAADVVIFAGGIDASFESEQSNEAKSVYPGFNRGDRTVIELPSVQEDLLKVLKATGKPVVFVNCSGSAMAMPWEAKNLPAILQAWYPGQSGGQAVAGILFGATSPSGRLPITFYSSSQDLPAFENYSMSNRTYRYFTGKPLFAFGHGLSYTRFKYTKPALNQKTFTPDQTVKLAFTVQNVGRLDGDEVAQVYLRHAHSSVPQPRIALCAFTRAHLAKGQKAELSVEIPVKQFRYWDAARKQYIVEPGSYELLIGAASDDTRLRVPLTVAAK